MKKISLDIEKKENFHNLKYDVCIVGSGPAGMSLVSKFFNTDIKVVILESGKNTDSEMHSKLNEALSIGEREIDALNSRIRKYGGASQLWAGTSAPFSINDFIDRPEVNIKAWPISIDEITPYYKQASILLGLKWNLFFKPFNEFKTQMSDAFPNLIGSILRSNNYFAAKNKDLTKSLKKKIKDSNNIDIFTNATVIDFDSKNKEIIGVIASSIDGEKFKILAKHFVLCAGAIETTRVLLNSKIFEKIPYHLGKNFMTHPAFSDLGTVYLKKNNRNWVTKKKLSIKADFELLFEDQKKYKILRHNITMSPSFISSKSNVLESSSLNKNKKFLKGKKLNNKINLLFKFWDLFCRIFGKRAWTNYWNVSIGIEQEPKEDRHLTLSNLKDQMNIPKLNLNGGEISRLEEKTISIAMKGLDQALKKNNIGILKLSKNFLSGKYLQTQDSINHHIGTIKMASKESEGVVDKNLKIFGIKNLYVSSSAVFPSSSNANPTFTISALSLRLGDHLIKKIEENI